MNQQVAIAQRRRVAGIKQSELALIELDKRGPFDGLEELSQLPQLGDYEFDRERVLRPSQFQPEKVRGELMIEGYERTLMRMPSAEDVANVRSIIVKALSEHSEQGIRRHVGLMVGSFPNARPNDGEVYVSAMLYDAIDLKLPDAVVAQACQEIRRSHTFIPAISEFLSVASNICAHWRLYERQLVVIEQRRVERLEAIAIVKSHLEWEQNVGKCEIAETIRHLPPNETGKDMP